MFITNQCSLVFIIALKYLTLLYIIDLPNTKSKYFCIISYDWKDSFNISSDLYLHIQLAFVSLTSFFVIMNEVHFNGLCLKYHLTKKWHKTCFFDCFCFFFQCKRNHVCNRARRCLHILKVDNNNTFCCRENHNKQ